MPGGGLLPSGYNNILRDTGGVVMNLDAVAILSVLLVVVSIIIVGFLGFKVKGWVEKDTQAHKK